MAFRWDGGFIMVAWDKFDEGVEWYTTHLGWTCLDKIVTPVGKKAFLKMPRLGVVTLKSFESDLDHFQVREKHEGETRLCFETVDLEDTLAYFTNEEIQITELEVLPTGHRRFDIETFDGTRLTVVHNPKQDGQFENVRVTGFSDIVCMTIGVSDMDQSIGWYDKHLGFLLGDRKEQHAFLNVEDAYDWNELKMVEYDTILFEQIELESVKNGYPSIRNYFDVRPELFYNAYQRLEEEGIQVSEIAGNAKTGWAGFHFHDPDGNQINVWSYPLR
ncbi:VOC family protein [Sporosarcina sp. Te-1]|uniref:VOC family protein n=1 Tax=Sporosarcina sp. Te-1 TaxID=2818390 RepID=UPI001A9D6EFD|nr:VOC family protein [Sporosarcina sp. Te-1]QTD43140.1 VOC family protein [Sporosarcina sp. Te-1]